MARQFLWWLVLVLWVAAALRTHQLGAQSLWNDEGNSYAQATRSFAEIAERAAQDIHPPAYYWALKVWRAGVGESEFALRYLSVLAGVVSVAAVAGIARRVYLYAPRVGALVGVIAALLVSVNTFQIYYSQEMRMYAPLAMLSALAMWALLGFCNRPTRRGALLLGVLNGVGLWTQYAFPLVMLAQGAIAFLWLWSSVWMAGAGVFLRRLGGYVLANVLALLIFAPLMFTAIRQVTTWPNTGDGTPMAEGVGVILRWFTFGITADYANTSWVAVALMVGVLGVLLSGREAGWRVWVGVLWIAVPLAVFVRMGLFREGNLKFLLPSQLGFALIVAQGIVMLGQLGHPREVLARPLDPTVRHTEIRRSEPVRGRRLKVLTWSLAALVMLGFSLNLLPTLPPLYTDPAYARDDYREIVAQINRTAPTEHAIILNAPGQGEAFAYYYGGSAPLLGIPATLNSTDDEIRADTLAALASWENIFLVLWGDTERDPRRIVETTLDAAAYEVYDRWYGDVRLARYMREPSWFSVDRQPNLRFGEHITLQRVSVDRTSLQTGEVLRVFLEWRTRAPLDARYKVFVQLLDENGALVAQHDAEPSGGTQPTTNWTPNTPIADRHGLLLPNNTDAAHLTLIIGLYNPSEGGARLPIRMLPELNDTPNTYYELDTRITITQAEG